MTTIAALIAQGDATASFSMLEKKARRKATAAVVRADEAAEKATRRDAEAMRRRAAKREAMERAEARAEAVQAKAMPKPGKGNAAMMAAMMAAAQKA